MMDTALNTALRMDRIITALAIISMGIGIYWIGMVFGPLLGNLFRPEPGEDAFMFLLFLPIPLLMSLPGILGIYFGYGALRKRDAVIIKRMLIAYGVTLAYLLFGLFGGRMERYAGLNEGAIMSITMLVSTLIAITVYWFISRYILHKLGHLYQPVRQSLSRAPIFFVALLFYQATFNVLKDLFPFLEPPYSSENEYEHLYGLILFLLPIVFAYYLSRFGVWLFVTQNRGRTNGNPVRFS